MEGTVIYSKKHDRIDNTADNTVAYSNTSLLSYT